MFRFFTTIFFIFLFYLTSEICHPRSVFAETIISASIGENEITLDGYSSPDSPIELEGGQGSISQNRFFFKIAHAAGVRIYAKTFSDSTGYFIFDKIILPKNPSELCLTSTDTSGRTTTPTCFPPPPASNYHTNIGPVILPPTLTINNDKIKPGQIVYSSGQSIPNSKIEIHFYKVENNAPAFPKSVQAYSLPVLTITTDKYGNFNLNLPTAYSSNYRLFATTNYKESNSPKSPTLIYIMPSLIWLFWIQNYYLIIPISIFFITLIIFIILLFKKNKIRYLPAVSIQFSH